VCFTPLFQRAVWYYCSFELLCRSVEFMFLQYPNLDRWLFIISAMAHKIRVRVEEYAYYVNRLRQNIGLKTWIWRRIVTSQTAHTKYEWPPYATERNSPHGSFLRTPLCSASLLRATTWVLINARICQFNTHFWNTKYSQFTFNYVCEDWSCDAIIE